MTYRLQILNTKFEIRHIWFFVKRRFIGAQKRNAVITTLLRCASSNLAIFQNFRNWRHSSER